MQPLNQIELVALTNSVGWSLAKKKAEERLAEMERLALDCEDVDSIARLVLDARAARTFWSNWMNSLDHQSAPVDNSFIEVSM